jgi:hypothetical protein
MVQQPQQKENKTMSELEILRHWQLTHCNLSD